MRPLALAIFLPVLALVGPSAQASIDPERRAVELPAVERRVKQAPAIAYLAGRKLHFPSGRVRTLPIKPADPGGLRLLGPSSGGWLVVDVSAKRSATLYTVRRNTATKLHVTRGSSEMPSWQWRLGTDGRHVIEVNVSSNDKASRAVVIDVRTGDVVKHRFTKASSLLDFDGDRAVLGSERLADWTVGEKPVVTDVKAISATISLDLLWRGTDYAWGPTSLENPADPPWSVDNGSPEGFPYASPSGTYVAEWWSSGVFVHAMSDGSVVGVGDARPVFRGRSVAWESDTSYLVEIRKGRTRALARCDVAGACERATRWSGAGEQITLPFETVSDEVRRA